MFRWLTDNRFTRAHHDAKVHAKPAYRDPSGRLYHLIGRIKGKGLVFMPCISGPVLIVPLTNDWSGQMTMVDRDAHCLTFTHWRFW